MTFMQNVLKPQVPVISVVFGEINYGNMDPQLVAHEKEHERIYKSIDKKELKVIILANKDLNNDEICRRKKMEYGTPRCL